MQSRSLCVFSNFYTIKTQQREQRETNMMRVLNVLQMYARFFGGLFFIHIADGFHDD